MLELLFLLLPIAAAYGWYMGDRSARNEKKSRAHQISQQYVKGLNLLFSEQSDKAVDQFIKLLQVDNETIDTHLALGNLFRKRGEVDRAIRIHENLIARDGLSVEQKSLAMQQLAKDYTVSGFFDRAEEILEKLLDEPDFREPALIQLLAIYQQTKEWHKAIACGDALVGFGKHKIRIPLAHFWCELAEYEIEKTSIDKAILYFKRALAEDPKCVRADIALAKLYLTQKNHHQAIQLLESVVDQDIDFVSEILPLLSECYKDLKNEQGLINFLKLCIERNAGASAQLMLSDFIAEKESAIKAQEVLTQQLILNPTMKGFYRLIDFHISDAEEGRAKQSLSTLQGMVGTQMNIKPHYQCRQCGYATQSLHWHCPSCKKWGMIKPIRGLDGE